MFRYERHFVCSADAKWIQRAFGSMEKDGAALHNQGKRQRAARTFDGRSLLC